jgi:hypothetical protein
VSQPRYPSPVTPAVAADLLERACDPLHHEFWPCALSLFDEQLVDPTRIHGPRQVTNAYLLAWRCAGEIDSSRSTVQSCSLQWSTQRTTIYAVL